MVEVRRIGFDKPADRPGDAPTDSVLNGFRGIAAKWGFGDSHLNKRKGGGVFVKSSQRY